MRLPTLIILIFTLCSTAAAQTFTEAEPESSETAPTNSTPTTPAPPFEDQNDSEFARVTPAPTKTMATPSSDPSSADASPSTTESTKTSPAKKFGKQDLAEFQMMLAESNFTMEKTINNRSELVTAYEKLLGPRCMPDIFKTLRDNPQNRSDQCNELLNKLLAIDPSNPAGICAQEGIDSRNCRGRYSALLIKSGSVVSPFSLRKADEAERKALESQIGTRVYQLQEIIDRTPPDQQEKIKTLRLKQLSIACSNWKTRLIELETSHSTSSFGPSPTPTVLTEFNRERIITEVCEGKLASYESYYPNLPAIACHRYGSFTPQCIDALRKERRAEEQKSSVPGASSSPSDIVGRF